MPPFWLENGWARNLEFLRYLRYRLTELVQQQDFASAFLYATYR